MAQYEIKYTTHTTSGKVHKTTVEADSVNEARNIVEGREGSNLKTIQGSRRIGN